MYKVKKLTEILSIAAGKYYNPSQFIQTTMTDLETSG